MDFLFWLHFHLHRNLVRLFLLIDQHTQSLIQTGLCFPRIFVLLDIKSFFIDGPQEQSLHLFHSPKTEGQHKIPNNAVSFQYIPYLLPAIVQVHGINT